MTNATPTRSYTGEDVYIGIDVHKKSYVLEARVGQSRVKRWTTPALPQKLPEQLLKYFDGGRIHTAYEAGFSGFVLHRSLSQAGIDSRVVHAAAVEVAAHNRLFLADAVFLALRSFLRSVPTKYQGFQP